MIAVALYVLGAFVVLTWIKARPKIACQPKHRRPPDR